MDEKHHFLGINLEDEKENENERESTANRRLDTRTFQGRLLTQKPIMRLSQDSREEMNVDRRAAQETILKMKSWVTPKKIRLVHHKERLLSQEEKKRIWKVEWNLDTKYKSQRLERL